MKNKKLYLRFLLIAIIKLCYAEDKTLMPSYRVKTISPRICHSAIYDESNKQMIIFGGGGSGGYFSDTWVFDIEGKTWEKIEAKNRPPLTMGHSAIYDPKNKQMLIFGGGKLNAEGASAGGSFSDTWAFDIGKKEWEKIQTEEDPSPRWGHSAIYDPKNKQMLIFGGWSILKGGYSLSDTWAFDIEKKSWKEIKVEKTPTARNRHSAVYDPKLNQMIIFGGCEQYVLFSDIWVFDIEKQEWKEIEVTETLAGRKNHTAVYDPENKQMIVFGGLDMNGRCGDTWAFDIENKKWREIPSAENPPPRDAHSATYDSNNEQMLIFSGHGQRNYLSDIWVLDIKGKQWKEMKEKKHDKDKK